MDALIKCLSPAAHPHAWGIYKGASPLVQRFLTSLAACLLLAACAQAPLRGSGDLAVIIERAKGSVQIADGSARTLLGRVEGLGDLSHASVVFSRDQRYAFVFGRDGSLSKVDVLTQKLVRRIVQAGNAIGGAISQDGALVVAQNYEPGGIKAFRTDTLELVADVPSTYGNEGKRSKVVGLVDLPGKRFAYALFDAGEIRITDLSDPQSPKTQSWPAGKQPYDGLVTLDGRYYLAGLFGEDGLAMLDTWQPEKGVKKVLAGYGRGEQPLPVFKMPHLRGWAQAGGKLYLPAIGRHEVLVVDMQSWREVGRIAVKSQPVFVMARPDGREVWVNFAYPDNSHVQVIDTLKQQVVETLHPGKTVLHMEFTPRGEQIWISVRDDHTVRVYDTQTRKVVTDLAADNPSGIFFTARAARVGF